MTQGTLHELFQWHYIHEVLHLLSGFFGSLLGTWTYFAIIQKRKDRANEMPGA
jgi:hypothetical protein